MAGNLDLQSIFINSPISIAIVSLERCFLKVNKAFTKIFGYESREILKQTIDSILYEADLNLMIESLNQALKVQSQTTEIDVRYHRKDGELIYAETSISLVKDKTNDSKYLILQILDVSEKKKSDANLKESETRYALAVSSCKAGIWEWNILNDKAYASPRLKEILGLKHSFPILYRDIYSEWIHPDDIEARNQAMEDHLSKKTETFESDYRIKHNNGHYIWVHANGKAIWDDNGDPISVTGSIIDITEKKEAEFKNQIYMQELEHMNEDLNDFAFIASHDLKEPIRGVSNNAIMLMQDHKKSLGQDAIKRIDRILFLCSIMEKLVTDLLHFAKLKHSEVILQKIDLNLIIGDIKSALEGLMESANAELVIPKKLPKVTCDPIKMNELFRNLITNGIKYNLSKKRLVEIGYSEEIIDEKLGIPQYVFYVKDNGIGIDKMHHRDIFRIFKRLNDDEQYPRSTGAGLTFVKKVVERHGGKIWVESSLNQGSTFFFTLS